MATTSKVKAPKPTYTYAATVLRVIDGDTIDARLDVGFRMWAEMPLRLVGLNTPELHALAGNPARDFTADWCDRHPAVTVRTEKNPEKYGRWLATVIGADGEVLNDALIAVGLAFPWDGQGKAPVA